MITKILRCPKCGSKDVLRWSDGKADVIYTCKYCGYKGPEAIEEFARGQKK